jgi:hypothetical protein
LRKFLMIAAPLALVACAEEAEVVEEAVETESAEVLTTANGAPTGTGAVTNAAGEPLGSTDVNADGTYQDFDQAGEVVAEGTWAVVDGKTCFEPTTEGVDAMCWTETEPAEDGSFTATPDEGDPVTVTPVVSEEGA